MRLVTLLRRDLLARRWIHAAVVAGAAVACAVLTGALLVGDSVRGSAQDHARRRLGAVAFALETGERTFRAALAPALGARAGLPCAAVLLVPGTALSADGAARAPRVQVVAVDDAFWTFGAGPPLPLGPGQCAVNAPLAARIALAPGDALVLRVRDPGALSAEIALAPEGEELWTRRLEVRAVADEGRMGAFSLRVTHGTPPAVFVARDWFARELGIPGRANALLCAGPAGGPDGAALDDALSGLWTIEDSGLALAPLPGGGAELRSNRVFLDPAVEAAALAVPGGRAVLTYFVNGIRSGAGLTPYSFVAAPGPPLVPGGMADDEIVLNDWTAADLGVEPGNEVELTYFVLGPYRQLSERSVRMRVHAVVPLEGRAADRSLLPDFPGLSDVENCTDWDPGLPLDLGRIRDVDEAYWDAHRGTPKAFVTLAAARRLWANPWGASTAVRWEGPGVSLQALAEGLRGAGSPLAQGPGFRDVRAEGRRAGAESVDFAQLFLGLGFFLIAAALLLTGLLFALGVEDRLSEAGTLLALGFSRGQVTRLYLAEGAILALAGAAAGAALSVAVNAGVLAALQTVWSDAVGAARLQAHVSGGRLLAGAAISFVAAGAAVALALRRAFGRPVRALLAGSAPEPFAHYGRAWPSFLAAGLLCAGAAVLVLAAGPGRGRGNAGAFFGAGALVLAGALVACRGLLRRFAAPREGARPTPRLLGLRQLGRAPGRALSVVALLATSVFLVASVGANRHDPRAGWQRRDAGTGGFAVWAETALPVPKLPDGPGQDLAGLDLVALRAADGDDASCLNLNRVPRPRLLGVDPAALDDRGVFSFEALAPGADPEHPWRVLQAEQPDGAIPAVADQTVVTWGLGKTLGDVLEYADERGRPFRVRLVGGLAASVFQGNLLIAEERFRERFPSVPGARVFLAGGAGDADEAARRLEAALQRRGATVERAADRLASFAAVENSYLDIFLMLGALAVLLGSAGLGVVVFRNVARRRRELALLRALGYGRGRVFLVLLWEHGFLFAAALAGGLSAAAVAVFPALSAPGAGVPVRTLAVLLPGLALSLFAWTAGASWLALRGDVLPALREE